MAAYCIAFQKIDASASVDEYNAATLPLVLKHGGELIAAGPPTLLEGEEPLSDLALIVRFPDAAALRAFYADPEYAPLIALRDQYSRTRMTMIDMG
jgi:uncharacterized protein (DUF1330 family)